MLRMHLCFVLTAYVQDRIYTRIKCIVHNYINTQKCTSLNNELVVLGGRPNLFSLLCVRVGMFIPCVLV